MEAGRIPTSNKKGVENQSKTTVTEALAARREERRWLQQQPGTGAKERQHSAAGGVDGGVRKKWF